MYKEIGNRIIRTLIPTIGDGGIIRTVHMEIKCNISLKILKVFNIADLHKRCPKMHPYKSTA